MSGEVEDYIERQKPPHKEIIRRLRKLILECSPDVAEDFKMGVPWYEGRYYIVALKDHVNLGFSINGLSSEEKTLFEGKGSMMRHIKFYSPEDVDEEKVAKLLKLVAEKSKCHQSNHSSP